VENPCTDGRVTATAVAPSSDSHINRFACQPAPKSLAAVNAHPKQTHELAQDQNSCKHTSNTCTHTANHLPQHKHMSNSKTQISNCWLQHKFSRRQTGFCRDDVLTSGFCCRVSISILEAGINPRACRDFCLAMLPTDARPTNRVTCAPAPRSVLRYGGRA